MRFVLAVAKEGTVSGAARSLGVNHATVLRRINAFEDRYDARLFDRTAQGYSVRADRMRLLDALREVGTAMQTVEGLMRGRQSALSGRVRVTTTDTFSKEVLPSIITRFRAARPSMNVALLTTQAHADFSRAHADVSVRPAMTLSEEIVGEIVAELGFAIYEATAGCEGWLGLGGPLVRSQPSRWLEANVAPDEITGEADSYVVLTEMARAGMGRAVLPCILGDKGEGLRRCATEINVSVPIWVACHADMITVSRISETMRFLRDELRKDAAWLAGGMARKPDHTTILPPDRA